MFLVSKIEGEKITILDTRDSKEEEFEEPLLRDLEKLGITIDGVGQRRIKVSDNLQNFSKKAARNKITGRTTVADTIVSDDELVNYLLNFNSVDDFKTFKYFSESDLTLLSAVSIKEKGGIVLKCFTYIKGIKKSVYLSETYYLIVTIKDDYIVSVSMDKQAKQARGRLVYEFGDIVDDVLELKYIDDFLQTRKIRYKVPEMCYILHRCDKRVQKNISGYEFYSVFTNKELEAEKIV